MYVCYICVESNVYKITISPQDNEYKYIPYGLLLLERVYCYYWDIGAFFQAKIHTKIH